MCFHCGFFSSDWRGEAMSSRETDLPSLSSEDFLSIFLSYRCVCLVLLSTICFTTYDLFCVQRLIFLTTVLLKTLRSFSCSNHDAAYALWPRRSCEANQASLHLSRGGLMVHHLSLCAFCDCVLHAPACLQLCCHFDRYVHIKWLKAAS